MPLETAAISVASPLMWGGFLVFILCALTFDLGVLQRRAKDPTFKQALLWCMFWMGLALLINLAIYLFIDKHRALEFLTGYVIEQSLSVDNIFVFIVIFSYFGVDKALQRRVLFYGILGAIVMRGIFVILGAELLSRFHWMMYVFGFILILSGIKLLRGGMEEMDPSKNFFVRLFKKFFPVTHVYHGERFFIREQGKLIATPLCLVLICLEVTDLVFAVDSVPAIFAITSDPFIVFTSNICAILGLRSIYFLLSGALTSLAYLKYGLSVVLCFIGVKMLIAEVYHISTGVSLGVIAGLILSSILASLFFPPRVSIKDEHDV